jgi:uncharacterized protein (UPF0332 family)
MRGDLTPVREFKRRAEQALPGRLKKVMLYGSRARQGAAGIGLGCRRLHQGCRLCRGGNDALAYRLGSLLRSRLEHPSRRFARAPGKRGQLFSAQRAARWDCGVTPEVRQRLTKARRLIRIARGYDPRKDPEGVAHHAYYAMYNAATAVFLDRQGGYPKTHGTIVGQFGLLVKDMPGKARDHGRAFREAFELRLLADYDAGATGLAISIGHGARGSRRFCHFRRIDDRQTRA